ncbi:MAG: hypothetical protein QOF78_3362 [Phycisphaerales bacterium]|jgi:3-oxoacyl-ACP reductase-like protein|nr:hypothetical protein [Phycisphaerales bacterium]
MAKKKTETSSTQKNPTPAKKTAGPAAAAHAPAPAKKPAAPAAAKSAAPAGSTPRIDTSLAANAAAAMIGNKATGGGGKSQPQKKESSAFKQMKAGLNKPSAGALGGAFGVGATQKKKTTQNYGGGKQIGQHNQTFGADVNRAGMPRRTPG